MTKCIVTELKDEAEELLMNIKTTATHVINSIGDLTAANNKLDPDCIEYRIRKSQISKLITKLVDLMERVDRLQTDLTIKHVNANGQASGQGRMSQSGQLTKSDQARLTRMSKSMDELRNQFSQVAADLNKVGACFNMS